MAALDTSDGIPRSEIVKLWNDSEFSLPTSWREIEIVTSGSDGVPTDQPRPDGDYPMPLSSEPEIALLDTLDVLETSEREPVSPPPPVTPKRQKNTPRLLQLFRRPWSRANIPLQSYAAAKDRKFAKKVRYPGKKCPPSQANNTSSDKHDWMLTPHDMRFLNPAERILRLAALKAYKERPKPVSSAAKRYRATARIKELAKARTRAPGLIDPKEKPFAVSLAAFMAKTTTRIRKLAQPKRLPEPGKRANPYAIPKKAIQAKATPRIVQLAQPKQRGRKAKKAAKAKIASKIKDLDQAKHRGRKTHRVVDKRRSKTC